MFDRMIVDIDDFWLVIRCPNKIELKKIELSLVIQQGSILFKM